MILPWLAFLQPARLGAEFGSGISALIHTTHNTHSHTHTQVVETYRIADVIDFVFGLWTQVSAEEAEPYSRFFAGGNGKLTSYISKRSDPVQDQGIDIWLHR